jgi:Amt family ammonium transporter
LPKPRAASAVADAQASGSAAAKLTGRILVAEDNEINQVVVAEMLSRAGFQCDIANTGRQAIEMIARTTYDLVLMDCQMPEMDGFEATRAIRLGEQSSLAGRRLPIVALTANAVKGDRERCLAAGMDTYLSKPVNRLQLEECIRTLLSRSTAVDQDAEQTTGSDSDSARSVSLDVADLVPPIDAQTLLDTLVGDLELIEMLVEKFEMSLPLEWNKMHVAFAAGDLETLSRLAHTLKGTASYMAAKPIAELAGVIERCRDAILGDSIADQLAGLRQEIDRCVGFLPTLRGQLATQCEPV